MSHSFKRSLQAMASVAICLTTGSTLAQEPSQPLRLAPVVTGFGMGDHWEQTAHRTLISVPEPMLWMMVRPSFEPDYAVELVRSTGPSDSPSGASFVIRWRQAKKNIWFASLQPAGPNRLAFHPPAHIGTKTKEAPFPADAAQEVLKAWLHMLQETRYPTDSESGSGMDGTD